MKGRTTVLIVFVAAVLVFATVSHGYPAQTTTDMQNQVGNNPNFNNDLSGSENGQNNMTNEPGSQAERPRVGSPAQPIIIRHVGWSWLLISGLIGYLLGRMTTPRRPRGGSEDIYRNRAA